MSLSHKLHILRLSLKPRVKPGMLLDYDHIRTLVLRAPASAEELRALIPPSFVEAYGDEILQVIADHGRDNERFGECIAEISAFARGDMEGMIALSRVFVNILKHYGMEADTEDDVLSACNLHRDTNNAGRLRRRRAQSQESDIGDEPRWRSSQE